MSTPANYVDFPLAITNVGSTPVPIFSSSNTAILQSIIISNLVKNPIQVYVYILRTISSVTTKYIYANGIEIEPLAIVDILQRSLLNIKPTDVLYAYSDFSSNKFTSFVSFEQLNEI